MHISSDMNDAINAQIGRELLASHQYINMAAYFDDRALKLLAEMFFKQAEEEREHALKFVTYLNDVGGRVAIPAVDAARFEYSSVEDAIKQALEWEISITAPIHALMDQAIAERDHATQDFLRWFITEQVEEIKTMEDLLKVVTQAGERNVYMIEAYLVHIEKND